MKKSPYGNHLWLTSDKYLGNHGCLHMAPMFDPIRQLLHLCQNSFFFPLLQYMNCSQCSLFLSYILVVFAVFQLMAKHAIDYSVFGGPQNFGKWMDVHSAPSCPAEVIKDVYFVFWNCFSLCILIYLYGCFGLFCSYARDSNMFRYWYFCFVLRQGHLLSI